jgi:hypothetical protein
MGHRSPDTSHAFSIACRLFAAPKKVNSFAIKHIQPLLPKCRGGVGIPNASTGHPGCGGLGDPISPLVYPDLRGATRHSFTQSVVCEGPLPLYFHQLAASLALPRKSTPLQSSKSRLFLQNTGGGVSRMQLRDTRGGEYLFAPHPTGLGVHTPAVPLATSRSPLLPWIP